MLSAFHRSGTAEPAARAHSRRRSTLPAFGLGVALFSACAATTPPPRFGPVSPADAQAPEGAVPPAPLLTGEGELAERAAPPSPDAGAIERAHTCPLHPQVSSDKPGKCPICGWTLVPKAKPEGPRR